MKSRILVIDDDEKIRLFFKSCLSGEGHELLTADGYTSTLEVISSTDLDVIIADIILGQLDFIKYHKINLKSGFSTVSLFFPKKALFKNCINTATY